MKKLLAISLLSTLASTSYAYIGANCDIPYAEIPHSKTQQYDIYSYHSINIINEEGSVKNYSIRYITEVGMSGMWQMVGMIDKKISLAPGQNFAEDLTLIGKVGRSEKGSYASRTTTMVNDKVYCSKTNTLKAI